jgi:hypothetical protein
MNTFSFKNLMICYLCCLLPIGILVGFLSLINTTPVYLNDVEYFGLTGLLISICISFFSSLIFAIVNFLVLNLGKFIYTLLFLNNK